MQSLPINYEGSILLYKLKWFPQAVIIYIICFVPTYVFSCDVCRGDTDSSLATGMDMAILTLLVITGSVMVSFASFFFYLRKKAIAFQNMANNK